MGQITQYHKGSIALSINVQYKYKIQIQPAIERKSREVGSICATNYATGCRLDFIFIICFSSMIIGVKL